MGDIFIMLFFQAWPFAFQHGGSLSCAISQRWNLNAQNDGSMLNNRNNIEIHRDGSTGNMCRNNYIQDYSENDYDERNYDDMMTNEMNCSQAQYTNYGYKENYCEIRNSYSSDGLINNV